MTANKEAKKIVVQSIQRVATVNRHRNSINSVPYSLDEIKGRISVAKVATSVHWKLQPVSKIGGG